MFQLPWSAVCSGPLLWHEPWSLAWLFIGAPMLEEWVLRAGLQEFLMRQASVRWGRSVAGARGVQGLVVLAVAAVFFMLHLGRGVATASMVTPVAVLLGLVYGSTRRWLVCAGVHALGNALAWQVCGSLVNTT